MGRMRKSMTQKKQTERDSPVNQSSPPQTAEPTSSFMGNMMTGFSLGMGQSIAFNAVNGLSNAIFGPTQRSVVTPEPVPSNKNMEELYQQCLYENTLEFEKCEYIRKHFDNIYK
tara:strand:- start:464 stop:805 length:342 start_codon:yes stop_codon:yes gene_type:complete